MRLKRTSIVHRFIALWLVVLTLSTSLIGAVSLHYCRGELSDYGIFSKAEGCCDNVATLACAEEVLETRSCCRNETRLIQNESDRIANSIRSFEVTIDVLLSTLHTFDDLFRPVDISFLKHQYKPPRLSQNLPVLLQSFLF